MPFRLTGLGRFSEPSLLILLSLATGDKHGYAIMVDLRESLGAKMGPATLYQAIDRLEAQGLIEGLAAEDRRRPYRITEKGRDEVREQLVQMQRLSAMGLERLGAS